MMDKSIRNCLVISYGPVPTPQYQTVEGGGMRAWGLAKGLLKNGIEAHVAINESFPQDKSEHEGIRLLNWAQNDALSELINQYDAVLVSYCMGDPSVFIAENLNDKVQLILDVYVPIYVEVSARDSQDLNNEYFNYQQDIARHNKVLRRGDYFICANEVQKIFYTGVLGSLGVVNPLSYRQDRIKVVPFGIHNLPAKASTNPYRELGIKESDKTVLWFGGLYPWFRIDELLNAVKTLSDKDPAFKFVIVGGKNPFNNNPDLLKQYTLAQNFASKHKLLDRSMFFVDWVDYDTRVNWYHYADFVISLNQPGDENIFAWRTRVMDFVWGEVVTLTNGSDPLGDELIASDAAFVLPELKSEVIVNTVLAIYSDKKQIEEKRKNVTKLRQKYFWENVTAELASIIKGHSLPFKKEREFALTKNVDLLGQASSFEAIAPTNESKIVKAIKNPRKVLSYAKKKGLKRSVKLAAGIAKNQLKKRVVSTGDFIFISHPIDNTGAPLVLLQIMDEFIEKYGSKRVRLIAPEIDESILPKLRSKGIRIEKAAAMSYGLTAAQLALRETDFVFMNTIAVYENYREVVFNMLSHGRINMAHWFIHEDEEQIKVVNPNLLRKKELGKISQLINEQKLTVYVPSMRVKKYYDSLFKTSRVTRVPLHVDVPVNLAGEKTEQDYQTLNFLISGTPSDGRKGQLIALAAFNEFRLKYYEPNPGKYRDFSLHLVSIKEDYVSQQIVSIGNSTLGKRLHIYPPLPRQEALEVTGKCNAVICCSLNETFGIYVAEGMHMGHVVLRNDTAGKDEQLKEGRNGYFIDSEDVGQFTGILEKLLNKKTMTNSQLMKMGQESQKMIAGFSENSYLTVIERNNAPQEKK